MSPRRIAVWASLAALGASALAACERPDDESAAVSGCASVVQAAADAVEVKDQIRLLDRALLVCRSFDDLIAQLDAHPGIVGFSSETFVTNRCATIDHQHAARSPICEQVSPTTTTLPRVTVPPPTYSGLTLDDREVTLAPGRKVKFVGDLPIGIQENLDAWDERGCDGLIAQRDKWVDQVDRGVGGDAVSVYARHAQHLVAYQRC